MSMEQANALDVRALGFADVFTPDLLHYMLELATSSEQEYFQFAQVNQAFAGYFKARNSMGMCISLTRCFTLETRALIMLKLACQVVESTEYVFCQEFLLNGGLSCISRDRKRDANGEPAYYKSLLHWCICGVPLLLQDTFPEDAIVRGNSNRPFAEIISEKYRTLASRKFPDEKELLPNPHAICQDLIHFAHADKGYSEIRNFCNSIIKLYCGSAPREEEEDDEEEDEEWHGVFPESGIERHDGVRRTMHVGEEEEEKHEEESCSPPVSLWRRKESQLREAVRRHQEQVDAFCHSVVGYYFALMHALMQRYLKGRKWKLLFASSH